MNNMSHTDISSLFEEFKNLKVAIIGDVMLDTYWWGTTDRISPEAPVPSGGFAKNGI